MVFNLRSGSHPYIQFLVEAGPQSRYPRNQRMPTATARPHNLATFLTEYCKSQRRKKEFKEIV